MKRITVLVAIFSLVFFTEKQEKTGYTIKRTGESVQQAKGRNMIKEAGDNKISTGISIKDISVSTPGIEEATGKDVLLEWFLMRNAS